MAPHIDQGQDRGRIFGSKFLGYCIVAAAEGSGGIHIIIFHAPGKAFRRIPGGRCQICKGDPADLIAIAQFRAAPVTGNLQGPRGFRIGRFFCRAGHRIRTAGDPVVGFEINMDEWCIRAQQIPWL